MKVDPARPYPPDPYQTLPAVPAFAVTSADFEDGEQLPAAHTGLGGNVSPRLAWSGFPEATRSFLVTATDPDPQRGTAWHWVVGDIPAAVTSLPAGRRRNVLRVVASAVLPHRQPLTGVPGTLDRRNMLGAIGFLGALPPKGDHAHRYIFAVHALDVDRLDVSPKARPAQVLAAAVPHTLARAVITGTYRR